MIDHGISNPCFTEGVCFGTFISEYDVVLGEMKGSADTLASSPADDIVCLIARRAVSKHPDTL